MSSQYSAKTFLRVVRGPMLNKCLRRHGIADVDLNLEVIKPAVVDEMFGRLMGLPPEKLRLVEGDFATITEMATEAGVEELLQEGRRQGQDFTGMFAFARNDTERACWTFLEHREVFDLAACFAEMDGFGAGRWRRRFVGCGLSPATTPAALQLLAKLMQQSYAREGRGRFCHLDHYLRLEPDRHCYFAYPEGHAKTDLNYTKHGELHQDTRKPAFEVIFVYRPEDGALETLAPGGRKRVEDLEACFGAAILGMDALPLRLIPRAYDLSMFKLPSLSLPVDPRDRIAALYPLHIRLRLPGRPGWNPEVNLKAQRSRPGIGDIYGAIVDAVNLDHVKLEDVVVASVKLTAVFAREDRRPKPVPFTVSLPDRCTLKDSAHDQTIRRYLKQWGIIVDAHASTAAARVGQGLLPAGEFRRRA